MISPGMKVGAYVVTHELGRGGMGVVYAGRDTRLDRAVAIKSLPGPLVDDENLRARFEREAKVLAGLSHANIASVFGLEEADGVSYLIMELVEGETLASRLERGAMSVEDAVCAGAQVAAAIEAAHEKSVFHRDIKPGNIMIAADGKVRVLDFGLAREFGPASRATPDAATLKTAPVTREGRVVGTPGYMSPEQCRGKPVDKRTDIFSFGCVLYECLTGAPAFGGETTSDAVAATLEREPDWALLPPRTPVRVRELLRNCLEKSPTDRLRDAGDARLELERAIRGREWAAGAGVAAGQNRRRSMLPWAVAGLGVAAAAWMAGRPQDTGHRGVVQFKITEPPETAIAPLFGMVAVSPDGRRVAFVGADTSSFIPQLWVRELDAAESRPLAGTEGGVMPFWSPDSRHLGFFSEEHLKRISIDGGPARVVCEAPDGRGGAWGARGEILFAPTTEGPLLRVNAEGGTPIAATTLASSPQELGHRFPQFLPDGQGFIYSALPARPEGFAVYLATPGSDAKLIGFTDQGATWAGHDQLLTLQGGTIRAQRVDPRTGAAIGSAGHLDLLPSGRADIALAPVISVSEAGTAAFLTQPTPESAFVRLGRDGAVAGEVPNARGNLGEARTSPDGRWLITTRSNARLLDDIWAVEVDGGKGTRLTRSGSNSSPIWSRDGRTIVFASVRGGACDIYRVPCGGGADELLFSSDSLFVTPSDITPDGGRVLFTRIDPKNKRDIWILPLEGDRKPVVFLATPAQETCARVSPDGRWVAYLSDETGRPEVYVRAFSSRDGGATQITAFGAGSVVRNGEEWVSWSDDGKELMVLSQNAQAVYRVPVEPGEDFRAGEPELLFRVPERTFNFSVAPDHRTFWVQRPAHPALPAVVVTTDWVRSLTQQR